MTNFVACQYQQMKLSFSLDEVHMLLTELLVCLLVARETMPLFVYVASRLDCCSTHILFLNFQLLEVSTLLTTAVDEQMCIQTSCIEHKVSVAVCII